MSSTVKGSHTGMSGAEYDYESVNVRPGAAPTSMWMALDGGDDLGLVALVGHADVVMAFGRRAGRRQAHPVSVMSLVEGDGDALKPAMAALWPRNPPTTFAVTYAGMWPKDRLRAVVTKLTGGGKNGWRGWAREFDKLRRDPQRTDPGQPDEKMTKELVELFFQQCLKAAAS